MGFAFNFFASSLAHLCVDRVGGSRCLNVPSEECQGRLVQIFINVVDHFRHVAGDRVRNVEVLAEGLVDDLLKLGVLHDCGAEKGLFKRCVGVNETLPDLLEITQFEVVEVVSDNARLHPSGEDPRTVVLLSQGQARIRAMGREFICQALKSIDMKRFGQNVLG